MPKKNPEFASFWIMCNGVGYISTYCRPQNRLIGSYMDKKGLLKIELVSSSEYVCIQPFTRGFQTAHC